MEIVNQQTDKLHISIHSTQPKNNLDKMLEVAFCQIDGCVIDKGDVDELQLVFYKVVDVYKSKNGKCKSKYQLSKPWQSNWFIEIGDFMTINLRKIKGEVITGK